MSARWGNLILPDNDPQVASPPTPAPPRFLPYRTRYYGIQAVAISTARLPGDNVQAHGHGNILHWLDPATDLLGPASAEDYSREQKSKSGRVALCTDPLCWCRQFDTTSREVP